MIPKDDLLEIQSPSKVNINGKRVIFGDSIIKANKAKAHQKWLLNPSAGQRRKRHERE